jgi:hypothetical protein
MVHDLARREPVEPARKAVLSGRLAGADPAAGWRFAGPAAKRPAGGAARGDHACQLYRAFPLEEGESLVRGRVRLRLRPGGGTALADLVWRDGGGGEMERATASRIVAGAGPETLRFHGPVPAGAASLLVILRPWRAADGTLEVLGGQVSFYRLP